MIKTNIPNSLMISTLKSYIEKGKGLSLTRIGDGEIHILNNRLTPHLSNLFTGVFGYDDPMEGLKDSRKILLKSLKNSDYIGIMGDNEISSNLNERKWKWDLELKFLEESKRTKEYNFFDCMIVRNIELGSPIGFREVIKDNPICIVTPIVNDLMKNKLEKHLGINISYVKVPKGGNLKNRNKYFKELDKIAESIVLVSNSLFGKDFPSYLSNKGKICIDMGATLDAWSGKITRAWFEPGESQSHCLIK